MKKVFLTLAAVAAFSIANAQFFIGGSLGFSTQSGTSTSTYTTNYGSSTTTLTYEEKSPSYSVFSFGTKLGYYFNDSKWAVGLRLGINHFHETEYDYYDYGQPTPDKAEPQNYIRTIGTEFGIAPFVRYHFADWNDFSLFAELSTGVMFGNSEIIPTINGNEEAYRKGPQIFAFSINIMPGVAYRINDNIQLEATLDLFGLNYMYGKSTEKNTYNSSTYNESYETSITESAFGLGVCTESLFSQSNITIGFVYRF